MTRWACSNTHGAAPPGCCPAAAANWAEMALQRCDGSLNVDPLRTEIAGQPEPAVDHLRHGIDHRARWLRQVEWDSRSTTGSRWIDQPVVAAPRSPDCRRGRLPLHRGGDNSCRATGLARNEPRRRRPRPAEVSDRQIPETLNHHARTAVASPGYFPRAGSSDARRTAPRRLRGCRSQCDPTAASGRDQPATRGSPPVACENRNGHRSHRHSRPPRLARELICGPAKGFDRTTACRSQSASICSAVITGDGFWSWTGVSAGSAVRTDMGSTASTKSGLRNRWPHERVLFIGRFLVRFKLPNHSADRV